MTSGGVESCAREMATGLAGYLERGRSAKEFVRAFVGACELAWHRGNGRAGHEGGRGGGFLEGHSHSKSREGIFGGHAGVAFTGRTFVVAAGGEHVLRVGR